MSCIQESYTPCCKIDFSVVKRVGLVLFVRWLFVCFLRLLVCGLCTVYTVPVFFHILLLKLCAYLM